MSGATHELFVFLFCFFFLNGSSQENNPLRELTNAPRRRSGQGDSMSDHKGSRRTSAWERILAELGVFQGPGLRVPFGLCMASGILFTEASRRISLLLPSLECERVPCLPCASLGETTALLCFCASLWESLLLLCSLLVLRTSVAFWFASLCLELLPAATSASWIARGGALWCRDPLSVRSLGVFLSLLGLVLSPAASGPRSRGCRLTSRFPPLPFLLPWTSLGTSFDLLRGSCWPRLEDDCFPAWVGLTELADCVVVVPFLPAVTFCAWIADCWGVWCCSLALGNVSSVFFGLLSSLGSFTDLVLL